MIWKIQQAMQDDAIRTARIHPAVHPGNRDEVFIWQKFPARLPRSRKLSQPALSYEHIGKARSRKRASPVNRAHMKRPLVNVSGPSYSKQLKFQEELINFQRT